MALSDYYIRAYVPTQQWLNNKWYYVYPTFHVISYNLQHTLLASYIGMWKPPFINAVFYTTLCSKFLFNLIDTSYDYYQEFIIEKRVSNFHMLYQKLAH